MARIVPPLFRRPALLIGSLLVALLAGCQDGTISVVLNSSGEDVEIAFANSKIHAENGSLICVSNRGPIMKSRRLFRRPGSVSTGGDWYPETSHLVDQSTCSVSGLVLKDREAVIIDVGQACSEFEADMRRRGFGLERFTPLYDRMTFQGRSGQLNLTGWQITARMKRVKREVCVLEVTKSDFQK